MRVRGACGLCGEDGGEGTELSRSLYRRETRARPGEVPNAEDLSGGVEAGDALLSSTNVTPTRL